MTKPVPKPFSQRVEDLASHARLLRDACQRFSAEFNSDEVRNIAVQLRVLVGEGSGNGVLFDLAEQIDTQIDVLVLNQHGTLKITEVENGTGRIVQSVERKALLTKVPGRLPIVITEISTRPLYVTQSLKDWIETGFLLDWEVPQSEATPKMKRFTPQVLINRYAGQEGAHSDSGYGVFGQNVEALTMEYGTDDKRVVVPVVYEYLHQIGDVVSSIALQFTSALAVEGST